MTAPGTRRAGRLTGWWYLPLTIATLGLLAWAPFLTGAVLLARRRLYWLTLAYGAAAAAIMLLVGSKSPAVSTAGAVLAVTTVAVASVQQVKLRRERIQVAAAPPVVEDPAITRALAARERRRQARELAARDPLLAKELRIGRPDLPHSYDDGGLVDLNTAPAATLAGVLGLDLTQAESIVAGRAAFGGAFTAVDDVFTATELPLDCWDVVRDHAVVFG